MPNARLLFRGHEFLRQRRRVKKVDGKGRERDPPNSPNKIRCPAPPAMRLGGPLLRRRRLHSRQDVLQSYES